MGAFRNELKAGRICILSWYDDLGSDLSLGNVALGAEDPERLKEDMQRIRDISVEMTF
jgi:hypothetical protein